MKASLLLLAALLIAIVAVASSVPVDRTNTDEVGEIVDMDSTTDFLDSDAQVVKREGRKNKNRAAKNSTGAPETAGQSQGKKGKKVKNNNSNNEEATGNQGKKNKNKNNKNKDRKKQKSGKGRKAQQAAQQPETQEAF